MSIDNYFKTLISVSDNLYLVGGSVRDYLLKYECYDYDFVIKENTIQIGKELADKTEGSFFILDYERETVRIVWEVNNNLFNFDIAKIIGDNIIDDLKLRDLTINSIAILINEQNYKSIINNQEIDTKYYIDPTNGIKDLNNKLINTYQNTNLTDDALRMIRAFRFATKLNFNIEKNLIDFIGKNSSKIKTIARERILKELYDILYFNTSSENIKLMVETGLFKSIFENKLFNDVDISYRLQELESILNNIEYIFESCNKIKDYLTTIIILNRTYYQCIKFALIFIELKNTSYENNEYIKELEVFLKSLKLSVNEQKYILNNVRFSFNLHQIDKLDMSRKELYLFFKERKKETLSSLLLAYILSDNKLKVKEIMQLYFDDLLLSEQPEIINGSQIMSHFNLKPSKEIGNLLEKVKQAQAEKLVSNYNEAIDFLSLFITNYSS